MHLVAIMITVAILAAWLHKLLKGYVKWMNENEKFALRQEGRYAASLTPMKALGFTMKRHVAGAALISYLVFSFFIAPNTGLDHLMKEWAGTAMESMILLFWFPTFWCFSEWITEHYRKREAIAWSLCWLSMAGWGTIGAYPTLGAVVIITRGVPRLIQAGILPDFSKW